MNVRKKNNIQLVIVQSEKKTLVDVQFVSMGLEQSIKSWPTFPGGLTYSSDSDLMAFGWQLLNCKTFDDHEMTALGWKFINPTPSGNQSCSPR